MKKTDLPSIGDLVAVYWFDAASDHTWRFDNDEVLPLSIITSIGIYNGLHKDGRIKTMEFVSIHATFTKGATAEASSIPFSCIIDIKLITKEIPNE